ncbi:MAG: hypothetical protein ACREXY_28685, partial [Gammaproteobacteria bacterium]
FRAARGSRCGINVGWRKRPLMRRTTLVAYLQVFSDGAYRDRTGDLRLAKLKQVVSPVSVSFRQFPAIPVFMPAWRRWGQAAWRSTGRSLRWFP